MPEQWGTEHLHYAFRSQVVRGSMGLSLPLRIVLLNFMVVSGETDWVKQDNKESQPALEELLASPAKGTRVRNAKRKQPGFVPHDLRVLI